MAEQAVEAAAIDTDDVWPVAVDDFDTNELASKYPDTQIADQQPSPAMHQLAAEAPESLVSDLASDALVTIEPYIHTFNL